MRRQQREVVHSLQQVMRIKKSEFLSVASHELRTPISIIRGFIGHAELRAEGAVNVWETLLGAQLSVKF